MGDPGPSRLGAGQSLRLHLGCLSIKRPGHRSSAGRPMDPACLSFSLDPDEGRFFNEQGYLIVPDALDPPALTRLSAAVDRVDARERAAGFAADRLLSFSNILPEDDAFLDLLDWQRVFPKIWGIL